MLINFFCLYYNIKIHKIIASNQVIKFINFSHLNQRIMERLNSPADNALAFLALSYAKFLVVSLMRNLKPDWRVRAIKKSPLNRRFIKTFFS